MFEDLRKFAFVVGGLAVIVLFAGVSCLSRADQPGIGAPDETSTDEANGVGDGTGTDTTQTVIGETGNESSAVDQTAESVGTFEKWSTVEIVLTGPASDGMSNSPNPFKILVDVTFSGPTGDTFVVPVFYDGDGNGGLTGNVWKVRFTPNATGEWHFASSSSEPLLDGQNGSFQVTPAAGCQSYTYTAGSLPDFSCVGRLEYVGEPYLKFAEGPYWLKGGADDPEDFLASGNTVGFENKQQAIDYLANKGVNSMYIMFNNVGGDAGNVWPWVGDDEAGAIAAHEHFNVAKLAAWEQIFTYIQSKGIVLHLVFEDDDAWTGFNREMYYREMIARFGHHNGLYWNVSEEYDENYSADGAKGFAEMIRALDPYGHPITVHNSEGGGLDEWEPFLGDSRFDLTSLQTRDTPQNGTAIEWGARVEDSGHTIPVAFDETGRLDAGERDLARHIVWSVYLGGGNFELHTSPLSDYRDFSDHFEDMTRARRLLEQVPFAQMRPSNALLSNGDGYAFATPGEAYVVYLPSGGTIDVDLSDATGALHVTWYNPKTGTSVKAGSIQAGDVETFDAPFEDDAVLYIGTTELLSPEAFLPFISTPG